MIDEVEHLYGTMIAIPRAALTAGEIAKTCKFISFGTNDLTQVSFGLLRDDISGLLPDYLDKKILAVDPFQILDLAHQRWLSLHPSRLTIESSIHLDKFYSQNT